LSDYPFYKVSDMNNEGNETFMFDSNNWISEGIRKQLGATAFPAESIIFAKVGAAVFLERKKILTKPSCIDNNLAALVLDKTRADVRFVHYSLLNIKFGAFVSTTALPSLSGSVLSQIAFALPPLPEQRAIAGALSDVDALIGALDQLIAKKRDLKQAAMQQLLTGQTRLPGFHGQWEVKRLGDGADIDPDNLGSGTPPDYQFNYISLEDVDAGVLRNSSEQVFRSAPSRARRKLRKGDILVSTVRPNLKSHLLFTIDAPHWVCSTGFAVVRCREGVVHPGYVFSHLFGYGVSQQIDALLTGSNYPAINSGDVRALRIPFPKHDEQTAIAEVLSDMDAELAALEQRRDKTRALKQGMMQELLTGRVRLR
jgi:type I restriction enzyme S subunit